MKGCVSKFSLVFVFAWFFVFTGSLMLSAQEGGIPDDMIKGAYKQLLSGADKNRDGKLSRAECLSTFGDKKQGEKDCKYWDANGDGTITESEYVGQVKNIMK